ncbi:hypothetical protein SSX86_005679 [Deinandra increscens subsp. villosa]|uniref:Uncharacterized protein n=1 Tax=Deinandra increscens subsp. villosa TaxID=3103831 RepID=A0AAP0DRG8_9ASTR
MNRRIRKQSSAMKSESSYLRFLKPGALAQLRDSKINARSHLRSPDSQIYLHRAIPSSPTSSPSRSFNIQQQQPEAAGALATVDGELPFLSARFYAPRCLQRKKLMAVRSSCYMNPGTNSLASDASVNAIDVL